MGGHFIQAFVKYSILKATQNAFDGPAARLEKRESARTPRAATGDSVPCIPMYVWMSVAYSVGKYPVLHLVTSYH